VFYIQAATIIFLGAKQPDWMVHYDERRGMGTNHAETDYLPDVLMLQRP